MQYPQYRQELLAMLAADQQELRACSKACRHLPQGEAMHIRQRFAVHSRKRSERALEILGRVGAPTIDNVGADGSQAISVLALHARLMTMKTVLRAFKGSHRKNPSSVYYEAIPSLTDRILII